MKTNNFKFRKKLLIDPQFQIRFLVANLITALSVAMVVYAANLFFLSQLAEWGRAAGLPPESHYYVLLSKQNELLTIITLGVALISAGFVILFGLIMSHRIAGPIYHIRKILQQKITSGSTEPFRIRKSDFFHELVDDLNRFDQIKK